MRLILTIFAAVGLYALLWSAFCLRTRRAGDSAVTALAYMALWTWALIVLLPCVWMTFMSFKESREIFTNPYGLPRAFAGGADAPSPWTNFRAAWQDSHFALYFLNSVKVVAAATVLQLFAGSLAAYALTRFRFRVNKVLLFFFVAGMMVPGR